jgi:hypothetical protein
MSPTINAGGAVTYQDAGGAVSLQALQSMQDAVDNALATAGNLGGQTLTAGTTLGSQALQTLSGALASQSDANAQANQSDMGLLSGILANNQQLAQTSQTGGATASVKQTNYIIWGLIGLAALVAGFLIFRK